MRSKNRKQRTIMLGVLCCMLVFMGIGYSIFSTSLNIGGTSTATNTWSILIESITPIENQTGAESKSATVDDVTKTGVSFSAQFQGPGDYMEYDVVVTNKGSIDARLETITNTITPESDAGLFEFTNNLVQGEGLKAGASRTFRVKVLFKPNATTLPTGQMTFNLDLNYIQGEGTDIGGGNGGADTTWDYKVDESGTLLAYNYALGKDVVVPAEVNGIPVTTITENSFKQSNAIMYQDGETMGIIITDEENYEALKEKFISWYTTECNGSESCLAQYQAIVISKEGEVTLSDSAYTQAGYIDLETGVFGEAKASINSLDLSEATNLTTIGAYAFRGVGLTNVEFGDNSSVKTIGTSAFGSNTLTEVEIPASVETIEGSAFYNSGIQTLTFKTEPEVQGQLNKYNNYSLSKMGSSAKKMVTQTTALKSIGSSAFSNNTIKSLILPEGIETIENYAFARSGIQGELKIPNSLTSVGQQAFEENKITILSVPSTLISIGDYAFDKNEFEKLIIEKCTLDICSGNNYGGSKKFGNNIKSLIIQSGEIGDMAFQSNESHLTKVESLILGSDVTYIGSSAFENVGITELIVTSSVNSIGSYAFAGNNFENLKIEKCTLDICSNYVFGKSIKNLIIESGEIGAEAFMESELQNLTLGEGVTSIKQYAFSVNSISELVIPSSVNSLGTGVFSGNEINNLTIEKCTTDICSADGSTSRIGNNIKTLTIESGEIGTYAFYNSKIENLTLREGVTSIDACAFKDDLIQNLVIPSTVTSIGNYAFQNNMIDELAFNTHNSLTVGYSAFENNQLSGNLVLPEGLTSIGSYAFCNNQITDLTIPSTVTSIGVLSFSSNPTLSSIFINRTGTDFKSNVEVSNPWYDDTLNPTIEYKQS